jgi:hypothetical protein
MSRQKLQASIVDLLSEHLGVAAEFVVEDAFAELDSHVEWVNHPQLMQSQFLIILERHLPREVPFARMRAAITQNMQRFSIAKN